MNDKSCPGRKKHVTLLKTINSLLFLISLKELLKDQDQCSLEELKDLWKMHFMKEKKKSQGTAGSSFPQGESWHTSFGKKKMSLPTGRVIVPNRNSAYESMPYVIWGKSNSNNSERF